MLTNNLGNAVRRYDYLPFGEEIPSGYAGRTTGLNYSATLDSMNPKFTGQMRDAETGLDYFSARYYSPMQGRFQSSDPENAGASAGDPQSWNGYGYVDNNPLSNVDPSGLSFWSTMWNGNMWLLRHIIGPLLPTAGSVIFGPNAPGVGQLPSLGDFTGCGGPLGNCGKIGRTWTEESAIGRTVENPDRFIFEMQRIDDSLVTYIVTTYGIDWFRPPCRMEAPHGKYTLGKNARALFQPAMAFVVGQAITEMNSRGVVPMITSGFRTAADQRRMRAGGSGTNPAAQVSLHQEGLAADVNTLGGNFNTVRTAFANHGLTWGGTFRHSDPVHFQLPPAGTRANRNMVRACGGN